MTTTQKQKKYYYEASYIAKSTRRILPKEFKTKKDAEKAIKRTGASLGIEIKRRELKANEKETKKESNIGE